MEETKRRRFIIRAVLEGEVDVQDAPPVPEYPYPLAQVESQSEHYKWSIQGNHVHLENIAAGGGATRYLNLQTGEMSSTGSIINNKPEWFSIPADTEAVLSFTNVVNTRNCTVNFRKANSSQSSEFSQVLANGQDAEVTKTFAADESVSCLFCYLSGFDAANATLDFDVEFTVGGERYF